MATTRRNSLDGVASLFTLVLIWGTLSIFPKLLSLHLPVLQQLYIRLGLATLFSIVFFGTQIRWRAIKTLPAREWLLLATRSFLYYSVGAVLYNYALQLTKVANSSFVSALPFTALLGFLFFGEKITRTKLFWVGVAMFGVCIIYASQIHLGQAGLGEVLSFFSGLAIALAMISRRSQSTHINDREASVLMLMFATVFIICHSLLMGEGMPTFDWSGGVYLLLVLGAALVAGMSFFMNYGFSRVEPALANNILTLDAPMAALFGFAFFREVPSGIELLGAAIIVLSVFGLQREEQRNNAKT